MMTHPDQDSPLSYAPHLESQPVSASRIIAGIGAIGMAIGVFLPWVSFRAYSMSQMYRNGDAWGFSGWMVWKQDIFQLRAGQPVLALAIACALGAIIGRRWLALISAIAAFLLLAYNLIDFLASDIHAIANPGFGLYLALLGAVVTSAASMKLARA